jgi:uncharacterized protein YfeS
LKTSTNVAGAGNRAKEVHKPTSANHKIIEVNRHAVKELEIDSLKRDTRATHIKEVENERDEYSVEIQ